MEHNKLFSRDPRFPEWYRAMKDGPLQDPDFLQLGKLRDKEVHQVGPRTLQTAGMSFPGGVLMGPGSFFETDFTNPAGPINRFRTGKSEPIQEAPAVLGWVWDDADKTEVIPLCQKGRDVVRAVIEDHDKMSFSD